MGKRLGGFAGTAGLIAVCCAVLLVVPVLLFNASPFLSALFVLALLGAFAVAWLTEFMSRKSYPSLFRAFEKKQHSQKATGDRDK
jgi:hypothetical protein